MNSINLNWQQLIIYILLLGIPAVLLALGKVDQTFAVGIITTLAGYILGTHGPATLGAANARTNTSTGSTNSTP